MAHSRPDPSKTVKYVVFDLGGVLIDCEPRYLYRNLINDDERLEWFLANICTVEWNIEQDKGRPVSKGIAELVGKHPEHQSLIEIYYEQFDQMIAGPITGMMDILHDLLGQNVHVYGLSNWPHETFPIAQRRFPILQKFKDIVLSSEFGVCKPDPALFEFAFQRFGINPEECVFIDNHPPNVETAEKIGCYGVIFTDAEQIYRELESLGFLTKKKSMKVVPAPNLACPLDNQVLVKTADWQLACSSGHNFDIARQGYVNLLLVQDKRSRNPGDTKEMVDARRRFLDTGVYEAISEHFNQIVSETLTVPHDKPINILDAGCGEGYYLERFFNAVSALERPESCSLVGMDISKLAIIAATKRNRKNVTWVVGTNRKPPVLSGSIDCIFSIFGYPVYEAFRHVLRGNGCIVLAEAGPNHLIELREIIYEDVHKEGPPSLTAAEGQGFHLIDEQTLTTQVGPLTNMQIRDLLAMTPHFYRIKQEQKEAAEEADKLNMTIDVVFRTLSLE